MLQPRTPRKLTLQEQKDMMAGNIPDDLLLEQQQSGSLPPTSENMQYTDIFGYSAPKTYLERRQMMRGEIFPELQMPSSLRSFPTASQSTEQSTISPQSLEEVDSLYRSGQITKEQADQYELLFSNGETRTSSNIDSQGRLMTEDISKYKDSNNDPFRFPLINGAGSDLSTELYSLGMGIGSEPGTRGRGMAIIGAGGAAALDIAGTVLAGVGFQKRNQYIQDFNRNKSKEVQYDPNSQSQNSNTTGGLSYGKYGGLFGSDENIPKYPDGGKSGGENPYYKEQLALYNSWNNPDSFIKETNRTLEGPELDAWYAEQIRNNPASLESNGQFAGNYKPVKVYLGASEDTYYPVFEKPGRYIPPSPSTAEAIQKPVTRTGVYRDANTGQALPVDQWGSPGQEDYRFAQYLDQVANSPEQKRNREFQAGEIEMNKQLLQKMTEEQKSDMRSKKMTPMQYMSLSSDTPAFEYGGEMSSSNNDNRVGIDRKVGDSIQFKYGGKMVSGVIKRIENGKIYL